IVSSARNYLVDLVRRVTGLLIPGRYRPFDVISPFLMIITNVALREIQTFSAMVDIYRGVPVIYTNYYGYDEAAHHFGATSAEALSALQGIDHQIRQISRICAQYHRREYDLYILSDHGMTPSVPFHKEYGQTLGQFIAQQIGEGIFLDEQWGDERQWATKAQFLTQELAGIEARLSQRGASLLRFVRCYIEDRIPLATEEMPWDLTRRSDVVVRNSGSLAHVYFNVSPQPMNLSEIALIYPALLRALIEHEGIGWVVGRESSETVIMSKAGTRTLDGGDEVRGRDPLIHLPEPERAADQLRRLASFPHSGDLILLGAWNPEEEILVSFEDQMASHGGLGGPQDYPFVMYPAEVELDTESIANAVDLYSHFMRTYKPSESEERVPIAQPHS
ncbi:MAG: alkaline phosphatase family protein, partial [Chloroflexota bacterium]|nr:alkaline phosphatase family protein [Chloroflexota bacterium]